MIIEIATLTIDPANADSFEAAVAQAASAFKSDPGCHGMALERIIEYPGQYQLLVQWDSVAAHMAFRETPAFQTWRGLAAPFFAIPPIVVHSASVSRYF